MDQGRIRYNHVLILLCLAVLGLFLTHGAMAQEQADPVPRHDEAERIFEQALLAFNEGDFETAYRRFRLSYEAYPVHRKTTAATLMAAKALYRNGAYQRAIDLVNAFFDIYPTSTYLDEAEQVLNFAQWKMQDEVRGSDVIRLGIALPLSRNDATLTQALFNGIRLAVAEYNQMSPRPIQMVFRDTKATPSGARQAVSALVEAGVDVIIGPLYSDEAEAAARTAEQQHVVLVAPLATDEGIAAGRRYVFQANPTMISRGMVMARLAVNDLQLHTIGIAAERGNAISERMAEGFQEEATRLGANVTFYELLPDARSWAQLHDQVGLDRLSAVDAVYLPLSGRNSQRIIEETLGSLDHLDTVPHVLGNSAWRNASSLQQASAFGVTYTDDFYVDEVDPDVRTFQQEYRTLASQAPGRLAYVGYDVARFLLNRLTQTTEDPLYKVLHDATLYEGLGTHIQFNGSNTNEAMFFLRYRNEEVVLFR